MKTDKKNSKDKKLFVAPSQRHITHLILLVVPRLFLHKKVLDKAMESYSQEERDFIEKSSLGQFLYFSFQSDPTHVLILVPDSETRKLVKSELSNCRSPLFLYFQNKFCSLQKASKVMKQMPVVKQPRDIESNVAYFTKIGTEIATQLNNGKTGDELVQPVIETLNKMFNVINPPPKLSKYLLED